MKIKTNGNDDIIVQAKIDAAQMAALIKLVHDAPRQTNKIKVGNAPARRKLMTRN